MVYVPEFVWLTPSHFLRPSSDTERGGCAKKVWISYLVFSLAYPSFVLRFGRASAALSGSGFATAAWLGRWPTNAVRSCPHSPRNTYLIGQLSQTAPRYSDDQESRLSLCSVITTADLEHPLSSRSCCWTTFPPSSSRVPPRCLRNIGINVTAFSQDVSVSTFVYKPWREMVLNGSAGNHALFEGLGREKVEKDRIGG